MSNNIRYRASGFLMMTLSIVTIAKQIVAQDTVPTTTAQTSMLKFYGVKILVPDIKRATQFYCDILHFQPDSAAVRFQAASSAKSSTKQSTKTIYLKTNSYKIVLEESKDFQPLADKGYGNISVALQVNALESTIAHLKNNNVQLLRDTKRREGIGFSIQALDPFGNHLSFDEVTSSKKPVSEPWLYNCGINVPDIDSALNFYQGKLGFIERTRQYMPDDTPLVYPDKSFAFMLHRRRADMNFVNNPNMCFVFEVTNEQHLNSLRRIVPLSKGENTNSFFMHDNFGLRLEIIHRP